MLTLRRDAICCWRARSRRDRGLPASSSDPRRPTQRATGRSMSVVGRRPGRFNDGACSWRNRDQRMMRAGPAESAGRVPVAALRAIHLERARRRSAFVVQLHVHERARALRFGFSCWCCLREDRVLRGLRTQMYGDFHMSSAAVFGIGLGAGVVPGILHPHVARGSVTSTGSWPRGERRVVQGAVVVCLLGARFHSHQSHAPPLEDRDGDSTNAAGACN